MMETTKTMGFVKMPMAVSMTMNHATSAIASPMITRLVDSLMTMPPY